MNRLLRRTLSQGLPLRARCCGERRAPPQTTGPIRSNRRWSTTRPPSRPALPSAADRSTCRPRHGGGIAATTNGRCRRRSEAGGGATSPSPTTPPTRRGGQQRRDRPGGVPGAGVLEHRGRRRQPRGRARSGGRREQRHGAIGGGGGRQRPGRRVDARLGGGGGGGDVTQSNEATDGATAGNANDTGQFVAQGQAVDLAVGGVASGGDQAQDATVDNETSQDAMAGVHNGQASVSTPVAVGGGGGGDVTQSNAAANSATAGNLNETAQEVLQGQGASSVAMSGAAATTDAARVAVAVRTSWRTCPTGPTSRRTRRSTTASTTSTPRSRCSAPVPAAVR